MVYSIEDIKLTYEEKYWKLRKIYLKLIRHHGSALLENIWLKEDMKRLKQEKHLLTLITKEKYINELEYIIEDFILTIDRAVDEYPSLEKLFEDNTDWYKDLAKHT